MREGATATSLELFFDLVFVFALIQVTAFMAEESSAHGVVRGVLILGVLWWSWVCFSWLSNVVRADEGGARAVLVAAMAAMFVLALTIPEAFDDLPGGLPGPVVIAMCYFAFRLMHLTLFWIVARDDLGQRRQLARFAPSFAGGTLLLLVASQFTGAAQTGLWALALLADYGGTFLGGSAGWRLKSASHFAERHGLILIVALGESIIAIGVGVAERPISWPIVGASATGLVLAAAMWWTYFDTSSLVGERALADEPRASRSRLARDAYSYLHFPLITGVVLCALGLKKVLEYVSDTEHHLISDPLSGTGLYSLYGGLALFLLSHAAFQWRVARRLYATKLLAVVVVAALAPLAAQLPALLALLVATIALVTLITVEGIRYAEYRHLIRLEHKRRHDRTSGP